MRRTAIYIYRLKLAAITYVVGLTVVTFVAVIWLGRLPDKYIVPLEYALPAIPAIVVWLRAQPAQRGSPDTPVGQGQRPASSQPGPPAPQPIRKDL